MRLVSLICFAALAFGSVAHADELDDALVNVGRDLTAAKTCGTDAALVARAQAVFDRTLASDALEDSKDDVLQKIDAKKLSTDQFGCQLVPSLLGNHLSVLSSLTAPDAPPTPPLAAKLLAHPVLYVVTMLAGGFLGLLVIAGLAELYLTPYLIAAIRRRTNSDRVLMMNIFLGWSVIGWIVAFVWAVGKNKPALRQPPPVDLSQMPLSARRECIARLSSLRASGHLTDGEFDILKARYGEATA
jgi:hypothetical protein